MNKKFVYQDGNNKKVILWCMANQIPWFFGHPTFNTVSLSILIREFFKDYTSTISYLEVQWKYQHGEEEMNGGPSQFCLGYWWWPKQVFKMKPVVIITLSVVPSRMM